MPRFHKVCSGSASAAASRAAGVWEGVVTLIDAERRPASRGALILPRLTPNASCTGHGHSCGRNGMRRGDPKACR